MNNSSVLLLWLFVCTASLSTHAQITKPEYDKMWAAATAKYNAATAAADIKKANDLIALMEKKYPKDAGVMLTRGVFYYSFYNDENKALTAFSKALLAKPGYTTAYLYRAKVLAKKGVYEKAIADITAVLDKEPQNAVALTDRGGYYFAIKDYENALKDFKAVVAADPANPSGYNDAANTLELLARKDEAENIYRTALSLPSADTAALLCFYGKHLLGRQKYKEAVAEYQKAMALGGNRLYAEDYNNAGVAAYKMKADLWAQSYFAKAIKLDPENVNYYDNKASLHLDQKDWNGMIKSAFAMLQINPNHAKANMLMYIGYAKSGRNQSKALAFKSRADELDKTETTQAALPDSVLFVLPTATKARAAQTASAAYVKAYDDYFTDFTKIDFSTWYLNFGSNLTDGETPLKYSIPASPTIVRTVKDGKMLFSSTKVGDVSNTYTDNGFGNEKNDIRMQLKYKFLKADSGSLAGLYLLTKGSNPITYYFLVNPVTKKYFIGYGQSNTSGAFHAVADSGSAAIPGINEEMDMQVITKDLELAFVINKKVIDQMPLSRFREINTQIASGFHTEQVLEAEIDAYLFSSSREEMSAEAVASLDWYPKQQQAPVAQQRPRRLLGTMMIHTDATKHIRFANVFGIYGTDEDVINEQALFSMLVPKCNPTLRYTTYTWKRGTDPGAAMKGWDLRDFAYKGNYYTTGEAVY